MINRIDITYKIKDTRADIKKKYFEILGLKGKIKQITIVDSYLVDSILNNEQIEKAANILTNPILEKNSINSLPIDSDFDFCIEIGLLPGVTDNVGATAKETLEDFFQRPFLSGENIYSSQVLFFSGKLTAEDINKITDSLYNPLIQRVVVKSAEDIKKDRCLSRMVPKVAIVKKTLVKEVYLEVTKKELERIGKEGIEEGDNKRRGPLSLDLKEMLAIRDYFRKLKRNPTDVELESIAQTWSEHCQHTIFNDPLDEIKEGIFKKYIKGATLKINKPFCASVFVDNSGAIEFDENYLITHKVETHNSPSALDPFGGAITGIVGVNRDTLGFGLGAKPIANVYGFCFADPTDQTIYYRNKNKTEKLLPAKRILEGVVEGVNVGGNSSGIPTPLGFVYFDERYRGKPLVFVGTVGLIPKKINQRNSIEKKALPGDYIVMVGGRVGIDGIHGATFSSEELNVKSQSSSVQIGDPITQKKLSDAIIKEARDKNLYHAITDNGAGGLSSSVGEMAKLTGGCHVYLDKVPLKYHGLHAWQIWVSESQERMTLAIPQGKWLTFNSLMKRRGVEATVIGEFTNSGKCIVEHNGQRVMDIDMNFFHNGRPKKKQKSVKIKSKVKSQRSKVSSGLTSVLEQMLMRLNITSYEFISQQFDHTVQSNAVLPPLHGKGRVNASATVIKPLYDSQKGVVLSYGINPELSDIDTYYMATYTIDSAIASAVAVGANPDYLAILDNFCWSSGDDPNRLYQLKQAARACYDVAIAFGTPFISGKDSMFNDFNGFDKTGKPVKISVPPTLLISTIGVIDDVRKTVTIDFKNPGDLVYLLGENHDNFDPVKQLALYRSVFTAIQNNYVVSAINIHRGGLAIAVCKSAIAGILGIDIKVDKKILMSEFPSRILISIAPEKKEAFENLFSNNILSLGRVTENQIIKIRDLSDKTVVNLKTDKALKTYKSSLKDY
ncbi:hypothetical protein A3C23_00185 [Candidatus Roizmanbacteria bacterium RIFCSPHIGHO2_02_FULL_37_13b]|nr:MAG: hypothetical protein A3C23_00185 [Candidatus Roizmanbacteria bacterium RIFCSPHIGHO2_02_FULL_37_13b]